MTRDEADRKLEFCGWTYEPNRKNFLDGIVALGLIKFDKPKAPLERLTDRLLEMGYSIAVRDQFMDAVKSAGLMLIQAP